MNEGYLLNELQTRFYDSNKDITGYMASGIIAFVVAFLSALLVMLIER